MRSLISIRGCVGPLVGPCIRHLRVEITKLGHFKQSNGTTSRQRQELIIGTLANILIYKAMSRKRPASVSAVHTFHPNLLLAFKSHARDSSLHYVSLCKSHARDSLLHYVSLCKSHACDSLLHYVSPSVGWVVGWLVDWLVG